MCGCFELADIGFALGGIRANRPYGLQIARIHRVGEITVAPLRGNRLLPLRLREE